MLRENATDLLAFLAVARERSFTKAAAKLGVSQSALSHTIRSLEARLGLRLLTRTTRSVSPTEAGEHLLQTIGPRFEEIEVELAALSNLRETPAGKIRISATDHSLNWILRPVLQDSCPNTRMCRSRFAVTMVSSTSPARASMPVCAWAKTSPKA
jgi:DNA-binding transcriptional LysR family regulator